MALRFGISGLQNTHYADLLALWQRAEGLDLQWASVFDHFVGSAAQLVERLRPFRDLGVEDFLLLARPPVDEPTLQSFVAAALS